VLERNRFAIQRDERLPSAARVWDIRNADTGEVVGSAREILGGMTRVLRRFLSTRIFPSQVEVREKPDDSLVFTLHRRWRIVRARFDVRDSMDQLVGKVQLDGGFRVSDRQGNCFAIPQGRVFARDFYYLTADGTAALARVHAENALPPADQISLEISPDLTEQPFAKMLLLAATLAVALFDLWELRRGVE
jgi:hypothetical protein